MDETSNDRQRGRERSDYGPCEAEFHLRLCARRLTTGHLQFCWRVEHVESNGVNAQSLEGVFGPFQLPHECANEAAAAVRAWLKAVPLTLAQPEGEADSDSEWQQLTLRDFSLD